MNLPKKQLRILGSLSMGYCCLNKHLHRMRLTTSPVCASCQLEDKTALHFVCFCPTLATFKTRKPIINASEFAEVMASTILRFAFQSGRLEKNLLHNSLQYVRQIFNLWLFYQCSFYFFIFIFILSFSVLFLFSLFDLREYIRTKQRFTCRSSVSIESGSTLLNPSIDHLRTMTTKWVLFWTFISSFQQHWAGGGRVSSWNPFPRVSTNTRWTTVAVSASDSINEKLADCIFCAHWGWIWFL
jgi:hypothetical protein